MELNRPAVAALGNSRTSGGWLPTVELCLRALPAVPESWIISSSLRLADHIMPAGTSRASVARGSDARDALGQGPVRYTGFAMISVHRRMSSAALSALAGVLVGCGTPGPPQPPSLNLPSRVTDLQATRAGDQVSLSWTNPQRSTDRLPLRDAINVTICRQVGEGDCVPTGGRMVRAPGSAGGFTETLPPDLSSGAPRPLAYYVDLSNSRGRSQGHSNRAVVVAGAPPAPVTGLTAEVRKTGVVLRWTPDAGQAAVRLERRLLTPPPAGPAHPDLLAPPPEPEVQRLIVEGGSASGRAIDRSIRLGETYEYRAQRVSRVRAGGETFEIDGAFSPPLRVAALDIFLPAVPSGLVAVAVPGGNGAGAAIDLSWQPAAEADVAGYRVYRREGDGEWQRISPEAPVVEPAFHDIGVEPGHPYTYAVTAVDRSGHESARSAPAKETVPAR